MSKILFHLGHPAHFHLFKFVIRQLELDGVPFVIVIKKKDVLEALVQSEGWDYYNVLPEGRANSILGLIKGQLLQNYRLYKICRKEKPTLLIGTSVAISHIGKLLQIPSYNVNEDDIEVVPLYGKLAYPWATRIIAPSCCRVGKYQYKKISYNGYHELAYLHPDRYHPNINIKEKYLGGIDRYFLIRFSSLNAHHDSGVSGIDNATAQQLISVLEPYGHVFITSERPLSPDLEPFRLAIHPIDMHDVLAFSGLFIGDSQTMCAEAGVLGIPFIRYNDFVGKISYLEELEVEYDLGKGILPPNNRELLDLAANWVQDENLLIKKRHNRDKMLKSKIDTSSFLYEIINDFIANSNFDKAFGGRIP